MSVFYNLSIYLFTDRGKGERAVCLPIYSHHSLQHDGAFSRKFADSCLLTHYLLSFTCTTHL